MFFFFLTLAVFILLLFTYSSFLILFVCLSLFDFQVWIPWRLHGGAQHGPPGEGPANQTGVRAPLPPCPRAGPAGPGGEPPAARRAVLHYVYESEDFSRTQAGFSSCKHL